MHNMTSDVGLGILGANHLGICIVDAKNCYTRNYTLIGQTIITTITL